MGLITTVIRRSWRALWVFGTLASIVSVFYLINAG